MRFGKASPRVFYGVLCIGIVAAILSFAAEITKPSSVGMNPYVNICVYPDSPTAAVLAITAATLVLFNQFIITAMIKHASRRSTFSCKTIFCLVASEISGAATATLLSVGAKFSSDYEPVVYSCLIAPRGTFVIGGFLALTALGTGLCCYHLMTRNMSFENEDEDKNNDNVQIPNKATVVEAVHHSLDKEDQIDQIL